MLSFTAVLAIFTSFAAAAPFSLPNGFPTPDAAALQQVYVVSSSQSVPREMVLIVQAAGGTLPDTPLPTSLPADATQTLQVIAYNEIFEVAFFSSFLNNVTNGVDGFTDLPVDKDYLVQTLTAIVNVRPTSSYHDRPR
jgi:hypothetical protein